jgi:hypothetical protein
MSDDDFETGSFEEVEVSWQERFRDALSRGDEQAVGPTTATGRW